MIRAFVAIDLPDPVRAALETVQEQLRVGRVADPETLHLTLAFLGEQSEPVLEEIHAALEEIDAPPFALQMRGLGTFGRRSPKVLWAGIEPEPALGQLRKKIRGAVRQAGVELPRERFRPHVTLARFGERMPAEDLAKLRTFLERFETFPSPPFEVSEFVLFQSTLTRDGPRHTPLVEYPLGGRALG